MATHRLAGGMFETTDLGAQILEGFSDPVGAWAVLKARATESRFQATRGEHLTDLIGREEELETLRRRWRRARDAYALMGDLLLRQSPGDQETPENWYRKAIDYARDQKTKMWQLRATTRLARLWHSQGRTKEARDLLVPMYGWFIEGFDAIDLVEAKALLEQL